MAKRPAPKRTLAKSDSGAKELARLCVEARTELYHAGRALHDQVGPLLSVAGLLLDQLRSDIPQATGQVNEVLERLNQGMDHVRQLSQCVSPTAAVRIGLKRALMDLAGQHPGVTLSFEGDAPPLPGPAVAALYEAASAAVAQAIVAKAKHVRIDVTGVPELHLKISDNGVDRFGDRRKALGNTRFLAEASGIQISVTVKRPSSKVSRSATAKKKSTRIDPAQSTIVSIKYQYASRRSAGG